MQCSKQKCYNDTNCTYMQQDVRTYVQRMMAHNNKQPLYIPHIHCTYMYMYMNVYMCLAAYTCTCILYTGVMKQSKCISPHSRRHSSDNNHCLLDLICNTCIAHMLTGKRVNLLHLAEDGMESQSTQTNRWNLFEGYFTCMGCT